MSGAIKRLPSLQSQIWKSPMKSSKSVWIRYNSTQPTEPQKPSPKTTPDTNFRRKEEDIAAASKLSPSKRFYQSYPALTRLSSKTGVPIPSLAISFLILHELTAFIPLFILFYIFQGLGLGIGLFAWIKDVSDVGSSTHEPGEGLGNEGGGGGGGFRGMVKGWYEEAEKRVEKVGKKYGILGYEKNGDSVPQQSGSNVDTRSVPTDGLGAENNGKVGPAVADAIAAYVVVKVISSLISHTVSYTFTRDLLGP